MKLTQTYDPAEQVTKCVNSARFSCKEIQSILDDIDNPSANPDGVRMLLEHVTGTLSLTVDRLVFFYRELKP